MAKPEAKVSIIDALNSCGAEQLAELRAHREKLERELEAVRLAEKMIDARVNGRQAKKPRAAAEKPRVNVSASTKQSLHEYLLKHGPAPVSMIAKQIGVSAATIYNAIADTTMFARGGDGVRAIPQA